MNDNKWELFYIEMWQSIPLLITEYGCNREKWQMGASSIQHALP
ncbi:hypothetical protein NE634_11895 [Lacrimispora saccharolytica]|nr:hypothetical protein [Lacrimispora saccharolytica]